MGILKKEQTLYRLPLISTNLCPVCGHSLKYWKQAEIFLGYTTIGMNKHTCPLIYCDQCQLYFINRDKINEISQSTGIKPLLFIPDSKKSTIVQKTYSYPHEPEPKTGGGSTPKTDTNAKHFPEFPHQRGEGIRQTDLKVFVCNAYITKICPKCGQRTRKMHSDIPVSARKQAIVGGAGCIRCGILYVDHSRKSAVKALIGNKYAAGSFLVDEDSPYDYDNYQWALKQREKAENERKEKAAEEKRINQCLQMLSQKYPSAMVILRAKFESGEKHIVIVSDTREENLQELVYHYSRAQAREYLSAAFAERREGKGTIDGQEYSIAKVLHSNKISNNELMEMMIPEDVISIGKDGGNYSSTFRDHDNELIDLLVYSLKTQQFEPMPATHNKRTSQCYTDILHFRRYVKQYGKPDLGIEIESTSSTSMRHWNGMNPESILYGYGYHVDSGSNLSETYRHELLAEIIDLQILTQAQIGQFLTWLIQSRTGDQYQEAVSKWEDDLQFVTTYRFNPERFLIAGSESNTLIELQQRNFFSVLQ